MTVSTGPSSRMFPHVDKNLDEITVMNSAEEISKYSDNNSHYRSPTLARRAGSELIEPLEAKQKKDKKWSLGGLFRRRKKDVENESSSDEETSKKGFLQRRKQKKDDKRKKRSNKQLGHFDHIVVSPAQQGNNYTNGNKDLDENGGILSDPTVGYPNYTTGSFHKFRGSSDRISSRESLGKPLQDLNTSLGSLGSLSQSSAGKKSRKGKVKARAEALRGQLKNNSSSDEESQRSTSSVSKFKSDDSLYRRDGSNRRSRSARTERYNRRLTKEDEHILNKEAELEKRKSFNKSDVDKHKTKVQVNRWLVVDELSKSPPIKPYIKPTLNYSSSVPLSQKSYSGISTIPPSHNMIHRTTSNLSDGPRNYFNPRNANNMYMNPIKNQMNPLRRAQMNYPESRHEAQRSFSYDCNINRSPTPVNEEQILHVHFPIGKPIPKQRSSISNIQKCTPPAPPPRDPQRKIINHIQYENARPMSYAFETGSQNRHIPPHQQIDRNYNFNPPTNINLNRAHSFGWQPNGRSNSEDHISQANQLYQSQMMNRPASATPDSCQQRLIKRYPTSEQYKYFAEKTPRSRKPIHIAAAPTTDQPYLSDSQVPKTSTDSISNPVHKACEFWKQKDLEEVKRKSQLFESIQRDKKKVSTENKKPDVRKNFTVLSIPVKTADSLSSLSGTSDTSPITSKQYFNSNAETSPRPLSIVSEKTEIVESSESSKSKREPPEPPIRRYSRQSSASSSEFNWMHDSDETEKKKRRSSNLEDALDELEAIYKSLRLGDEDLLDRAERRDVSSTVKEKILSKNSDSSVNWANSGAQSDSGFNYDFDRIDGFRRKQPSRKSCVPDKLNDDMAYRRLYKDRPPPLDVNVAVSQVSYLLASPVLGASANEENFSESFSNNSEPDITLDDVVYRNIKHTNNTLKVVEPQPPFGIPLGPITGASNSDYLHAVPENRSRSRFVPQKSPDIVKDDLAYRTLRKDSPGLGTDDYLNNNNTKMDNSFKKRKAVRSISANIYNMMHRDNFRRAESENEFDRAQSLTDIADAMEVARQILKDRQNNFYRKVDSSDNDSKVNSKNIVTSTETLIEKSNSSQGNEETVNQKPPICPTPDRTKTSKVPTKDSTPTNPVSPALEENMLDKKHLEDLLTALAIEAQETSEKLGNDLKLLDEEQSKKCSPRLSQTSTPINERAKSPTVSKSLDEKLSDIDAVSEHAKLCEKLLGAVVESTKLISHSVTPTVFEEVNDMPTEPKIYKSVANIIVTRKAEAADSDLQSEHDYENIREKSKTPEEKCTSPFEENKNRLLADFQQLKKNLFSDEDNKSQSKEDLQNSSKDSEETDTFNKLQESSCSEEGEVCSAVCFASNSPTTDYDPYNEICITPPESFTSSPEFYLNLDNSLQNYISRNRSEHSSGFHTESSSTDSSLNFSSYLTDKPFELTKIIDEIIDTAIEIISQKTYFNPIISNSSLQSSTTFSSSILQNKILTSYIPIKSTSSSIFPSSSTSMTSQDEINKQERQFQSQTVSSVKHDSSVIKSSCSPSKLLGSVSSQDELDEVESDPVWYRNSTSSSIFPSSSTSKTVVSSQDEINKQKRQFQPQTVSSSLVTESSISLSKPLNSSSSPDEIDKLKSDSVWHINPVSSYILPSPSTSKTIVFSQDEINKQKRQLQSQNVSSLTDSKFSSSLSKLLNSSSSQNEMNKEENDPVCHRNLTSSSIFPSPSTSRTVTSSQDEINKQERQSQPQTVSAPAVHDSIIIKSSCSSSKPLNSSSSQDEMDKVESDVAWYRNPTSVALACSYSVAFLHQFAILDIVTLLGLLLAIITVFAAYIL